MRRWLHGRTQVIPCERVPAISEDGHSLRGAPPGPLLQTEMRGCATLATDVAVDITSLAFRYGGGEALYLSSDLQRCHRDIDAAAQHLFVGDSVDENLGKFALGHPDVADVTGDVR